MTVSHGDLCSLALAARSFSVSCALTCLLQPILSWTRPREKVQMSSCAGRQVLLLQFWAWSLLPGQEQPPRSTDKFPVRKGVPGTWCWVLVPLAQSLECEHPNSAASGGNIQTLSYPSQQESSPAPPPLPPGGPPGAEGVRAPYPQQHCPWLDQGRSFR